MQKTYSLPGSTEYKLFEPCISAENFMSSCATKKFQPKETLAWPNGNLNLSVRLLSRKVAKYLLFSYIITS